MAKLTKLTLASGILILVASSLLSASTARQEPLRLKKITLANEPIQITAITLGSEKLSLGQNFNAPENWIDKLELEVKNTSGQNIERLEIEMRIPLPEAERETFLSIDFTHLGRLAPDNTIKVKAPAGSFQWVMSETKTLSRNASFMIKFVTFQGGTAWRLGDSYRLENNKWVKVDKEQVSAISFCDACAYDWDVRVCECGEWALVTVPQCDRNGTWQPTNIRTRCPSSSICGGALEYEGVKPACEAASLPAGSSSLLAE